MTLATTIAIIGSYFLGSIPTGLWLGQRLRGVDIREHGSKNIGATNTLRVLGKKLGSIALAGDIAKGALAVTLGRIALMQFEAWSYTPLVCGFAAILGHTFSIFTRFNGGKGVATSAGVFLALAWEPTLAAVIVFAITTAYTRMVSAGSISAAATLVIAAFLFDKDWVLLTLIAVVAGLVILKHRSNIWRILQGTESRLGQPGPLDSTDPR